MEHGWIAGGGFLVIISVFLISNLFVVLIHDLGFDLKAAVSTGDYDVIISPAGKS